MGIQIVHPGCSVNVALGNIGMPLYMYLGQSSAGQRLGGHELHTPQRSYS